MKKQSKALLILMMGALLAAGCATPTPLALFNAQDLNPKVRTGQLSQKADNFLVILDASGSMARSYKGQVKLDLARNFVHRMNQTIPDIKVMGGLRKLGGMSNPFAKKTALIYGMADYTKAGLEGTLKSVCSPKGETPLASAIQAAGTDLKGSRGDIAVIIVSDGKETKAEPITAAKRLKDQYGDQLCIFTVLVGNDPAGQKNMEQVARAGRCGFLVSEENTRSSAAMADFVESVFFAK